MKLSFKILINLFFVIALAYWLSNLAFFVLQKVPLFFYPSKKVINFFDIEIANLFFKDKSLEKKVKYEYFNEFKLVGVYNDGKKGFVIIKDKNKNIFVDLNKSYKGYQLVKINLNSAIFEKGSKKYILDLNRKNTNYKSSTPSIHIIKRETVVKYAKNLRLIWKNIAINKVKEGYKIFYVNPKSILWDLGLRKGDILLEVNGVKLKNDSDAWNLYNNFNKFDRIKLVIKRNNKIKVLRYEIN